MSVPVALITGITGQTGSYLAEQLRDAGWQINGIVRDADDAREEFTTLVPEAILHSGNLEDPARMGQLVREVAPNAVFNLGGISSVAQSWSDPELTARVTGVGVVALLEASWQLQEKGDGRRVSFVQASSAEIFGDAQQLPQNEDTPIRPVNPYGAAKAYAHHLVAVYRRRGLAASNCILYNHESPRRPATFVTRKITKGVADIAAGRASELVLGNLDVVRDWGWAPDYAAAIALAAESEPGDYVIATGESHTVRDFVEAAFTAAGITDWEQYIRQDPAFMRPADAAALVGDASRARATLGWKPAVDFSQMVAAMVNHDVAASSLS